MQTTEGGARNAAIRSWALLLFVARVAMIQHWAVPQVPAAPHISYSIVDGARGVSSLAPYVRPVSLPPGLPLAVEIEAVFEAEPPKPTLTAWSKGGTFLLPAAPMLPVPAAHSASLPFYCHFSSCPKPLLAFHSRAPPHLAS